VPAAPTGDAGTARLALAAVDAAAQPTQAASGSSAAPGRATGTAPAADAANTPAAGAATMPAAGGSTAAARTSTSVAGAAAPSDPATVPAAGADATTQATAAPSAQTPDHRGDHRRQQPTKPAPPNAACSLIVPANPTTERGLTTAYQLTATERGAGACHETDPDQAAFVEAAVLDLDTGALGVYHPLVVDAGTTPAIAPAPVRLPAHAVVGVWFGFNGDTLTLDGAGAASCVNGLRGSRFGQFAYCNAQQFFAAANAAIAAHRLVVPPLGTGSDGLPCPTTRDFSVVDQDQSDNLATAYRVIKGRVAQDVPAASVGAKLTNGSDEGLLAKAIDPALGCAPFTAPDLTVGGATNTPALALNELSAAAWQAAPAALVPTSDPMVQVDGATSVEKTDLYRAGVDQPALPAGQSARAYCAELVRAAPARLKGALPQFRGAPSPAVGSANLYAFLADRYRATLQNLNCATGG
jgi:hypothetical protein